MVLVPYLAEGGAQIQQDTFMTHIPEKTGCQNIELAA